MQKNKYINTFIIATFVSLYAIVSIISTIHVIEFFKLSNPNWLAVSLAIAFEIGAAASLASIIALRKMNKSLVWGLFITLTLMQMMGNTYYAFKNLENFQDWVDLFGLTDSELVFQKRVLAIISGAILPLIALGFIKSLVDYIRPDSSVEETPGKNDPDPTVDLDMTLWDNTLNDGLDELETEEATNTGIENEAPVSPIENVSDDLLEALEKTGELTKEDIENYKEKTRMAKKEKSGRFMNPQIMPGVNM